MELVLLAGAGVTVAIGSIGARGVVVTVAVAAIGCGTSEVSSSESLVLEWGMVESGVSLALVSWLFGAFLERFFECWAIASDMCLNHLQIYI